MMRTENVAAGVVDCLLDQQAEDLVEATVRLPPRGTRWIAVYTGPEPGQQIWRSTGLTDHDAALALAKKWAAQARRQRAVLSGFPKKPTMRVRPGSGEAAVGLLTQEEAAAILGLSVRAIRGIERRAFEKLRRHPALRRFWREHATGDVEEAATIDLDRSEIAALFGLVRTSLERQALKKLLAAILADRLLEI